MIEVLDEEVPSRSLPPVQAVFKQESKPQPDLFEDLTSLAAEKSDRPLIKRIYEETKSKPLIEEIPPLVNRETHPSESPLIVDMTNDRDISGNVGESKDAKRNPGTSTEEENASSSVLITELPESMSGTGNESSSSTETSQDMGGTLSDRREWLKEFAGDGTRIPRSWHILEEEREKAMSQGRKEEVLEVETIEGKE